MLSQLGSTLCDRAGRRARDSLRIAESRERLRHLQELVDPWVLGIATVAFLLEFLAHKIPWVDSLWDGFHTFIRPVGAAVRGITAAGGLDPTSCVVLGLLTGTVALTGHTAKAGTRLAVNHSPEPFSNIALSLGEDASSVFGSWLAVTPPAGRAGPGIGLPCVVRRIRADSVAAGATGMDGAHGRDPPRLWRGDRPGSSAGGLPRRGSGTGRIGWNPQVPPHSDNPTAAESSTPHSPHSGPPGNVTDRSATDPGIRPSPPGATAAPRESPRVEAMLENCIEAGEAVRSGHGISPERSATGIRLGQIK